MKHLIDQGADVYMKERHEFPEVNVYGRVKYDNLQGVPPLHIGSQYFNVGGIQVLLDHAQSPGGVDMNMQADDCGRLPLHWAATGPDNVFYVDMPEDEEVIPRIVATLELLLAADPGAVNVQDKEGNTALHYAVWTHGRWGDRHVPVVRVLCEHGADASIRGQNEESVLHGLGFRVRDGKSIDTSLIDLLLEHGASIDDTDRDGNTPLHFAAKNLPRVEAAQHLVSRGADVSATNHQGNTPLHQAAGGNPYAFQFPHPTSDGSTAKNNIKVLEEMMKVLLHRVSGETADALVNQPNVDGRTSR